MKEAAKRPFTECMPHPWEVRAERRRAVSQLFEDDLLPKADVYKGTDVITLRRKEVTRRKKK